MVGRQIYSRTTPLAVLSVAWIECTTPRSQNSDYFLLSSGSWLGLLHWLGMMNQSYVNKSLTELCYGLQSVLALSPMLLLGIIIQALVCFTNLLWNPIPGAHGCGIAAMEPRGQNGKELSSVSCPSVFALSCWPTLNDSCNRPHYVHPDRLFAKSCGRDLSPFASCTNAAHRCKILFIRPLTAFTRVLLPLRNCKASAGWRDQVRGRWSFRQDCGASDGSFSRSTWSFESRARKDS